MRSIVKSAIPRISKLSAGKFDGYKMKEKGRKGNYSQFNISEEKMVKMERLLNTESINSFVEVSLRAQSCPMPLNVDLWDGLKCPYQCKYCFADYFRHSLYTSFFDNGKTMGLRHSAPSQFKGELDQLFRYRHSGITQGENEVQNAIRLEIPLRLGIRFEDFSPIERTKGISLELLRYLRDAAYPVMINTKSDIPGDEKYIEALASNKAGAAIHFTMISSDETFLKLIEPGAPSFEKRLSAVKKLSAAGVRCVARIEPWMIFLNDEKGMVDDYIGKIKEAGIRHMTFDSYSYSAGSNGLSENFSRIGMDFERMFLLSADSQWLSSLMLGKFMEYFQQNGLKCATFDQGNATINDDWICCTIGDHFPSAGFNWGSGVIAIRFIQSRSEPTRWRDFEKFVQSKGGFLSSKLKQEVRLLWNGIGDAAWPIYWGQGIIPIGLDEHGTIWKYEKNNDFRKDMFNTLFGVNS